MVVRNVFCFSFRNSINFHDIIIILNIKSKQSVNFKEYKASCFILIFQNGLQICELEIEMSKIITQFEITLLKVNICRPTYCL